MRMSGYRLQSRRTELYRRRSRRPCREAAAGSPTARVTATGALEACAGLVGRSFATSTVETENASIRAALTPSFLEIAGAGAHNARSVHRRDRR